MYFALCFDCLVSVRFLGMGSTTHQLVVQCVIHNVHGSIMQHRREQPKAVAAEAANMAVQTTSVASPGAAGGATCGYSANNSCHEDPDKRLLPHVRDRVRDERIKLFLQLC